MNKMEKICFSYATKPLDLGTLNYNLVKQLYLRSVQINIDFSANCLSFRQIFRKKELAKYCSYIKIEREHHIEPIFVHFREISSLEKLRNLKILKLPETLKFNRSGRIMSILKRTHKRFKALSINLSVDNQTMLLSAQIPDATDFFRD